MAGSSKKQGGKNKKTTAAKKPASKSVAAKKPASKSVATKKPAAKKPKSATVKKPASFSKKASDAKKPVVAKKVVGTKKDEFETFRIVDAEKIDSKIVLRDVTKEKIIEKIEPKKEATEKPEPMPVFHPVSRPHPVENPVKVPAKELKEQEIKKAVNAATKLPVEKRRRRKVFGEFGWGRVVLAAACITTAIFAVVYFVNLTSSNMSLQVAATQSGIEAKYPSYVPRGYEMSDVTSSSGKILMHFMSDDGEFTLSEETSSWDSEGLLNNLIKPTYGSDYTVVREQGLTLYMGSNWQIWVNGGMLYKLNIVSGTLTKKQLKTIATSL